MLCLRGLIIVFLLMLKGGDRSTWWFYAIHTDTSTSRDVKYQTWAGKHLQLLEQKFHEVSRRILFGQIGNACRHPVQLDAEHAGIRLN